VRKNFLDMAINSIGPVEMLLRESREIGLFSSEANGSVLHLDKVGDDTLNSLEVSFPWSDPETRHHHNGSGDVDPPKQNRPLECTDE